jgi:hypothetical protein
LVCYCVVKKPEAPKYEPGKLAFIFPGVSIYYWILSKFKKKKMTKYLMDTLKKTKGEKND